MTRYEQMTLRELNQLLTDTEYRIRSWDQSNFGTAKRSDSQLKLQHYERVARHVRRAIKENLDAQADMYESLTDLARSFDC